jgi:cystathionine beta-lyase/cystathionine gamma-synthase
MTKSSAFRLDSASRGAAGFTAFGRLYPDDPGYTPVYVYDRLGEPNNQMLQQTLATAEEKEIAVTFSTGMAAVSAAVLFLLDPGAEVISHQTVYGCTYSLFKGWMPRFGYKVHFSDFKKPESFLELVNENTKVIYLESPANPTLDLLDLEAIIPLVAKLNEERPANKQIVTIMDNTFATPFCQRPGKFGVDIVVHSLTKGLCGFGTAMGGAVITQKKFRDQLMMFRKDFGGTLAPDSAWHVLTYGLSTLALRARKAQENAFEVARFLESHHEVEAVVYPGLESFPQYEIAQRMLRDYDGNFAPGMMLYFELKGDSAAHQKSRGEMMMNFIADNSYAVTLAVSLGQTRTLIEHPGSMTHSAYSAEEQIAAGMHPGGIRLALGLEHSEDIIKDLDQALSFVAS